MKRPVLRALIVAACLLPAAARAETASTTLPVLVRILPVASVSAGSLDFGRFTTDMSTVSAQAVITVVVSAGLPYQITLSAGAHYSGDWRNVERSGFLIRYGLFAPSGHEWGDADFDATYPWGRSVPGTGTGTSQDRTVQGTLSVNQVGPGFPPGTYQDVVTVTVYY